MKKNKEKSGTGYGLIPKLSDVAEPGFDWGELDAVQEAALSEPPPGWFSRKQFAARYHLTHEQAIARVRTLLRSGKLERMRVMLDGRQDSVFRIPTPKIKG